LGVIGGTADIYKFLILDIRLALITQRWRTHDSFKIDSFNP